MPDRPNPTAGRLPRSPALMDAGETALLVIDLQERILAAIADADRVVWNCRRLVDGAGLLGVPVAVTEQYPEKLGGTVGEVAESLTALGADPPLPKLAFSCGEHPEIVERWQQQDRRKVLLCGIEAHVCVLQTALDYVAAGFEVYVAADATASRYTHDRRIALDRLEASGVTLTTTESALCEWAEAAGTPHFKQISGLLKEKPPAGPA